MSEEITNEKAWSGDNAYLQTIDAVETALKTDRQQGLTSEEARHRLETYGPNVLEEDEKTTWLQRFVDQFKDFMILILILAAIVSGAMGEMLNAIVIIAIVVINAVLGVLQEGKAEKAIEALQKMSAPHARVLRGGSDQSIDAADLVPGDVVLLEAGDVVPADIRLFESSNLKAEEAALTGESVPVEKFALAEFSEPVGLGDRDNVVFSGTAITYGRARGIVVGSGSATEMGKIASQIKGITQEMTPLQRSLNQLGKVLGIIVLIVCAIVFFVGLLQGGEILTLFMTAVSLAVAAIPEGLPAVVTIVLALGMNRMASKNAIMKRLLAVETLGSVDTICSDKTGTLTQNEMTVTRIYANNRLYEVSGSGYDPSGEIKHEAGVVDSESDRVLKRLLSIGVLNNDASLKEGEDGYWTILGDPTEGAMLSAGAKGGIDHQTAVKTHPRVDELPFDSERKMMSVFHDTFEEGAVSLTKGAPDIILSNSRYELTDQGEIELTDERRQAILKMNDQLAAEALRVLGFAYKHHADNKFETAESDMVFVGLMGMIDPARPEVKSAIEVCKNAGIRAVMITGDYKETAVAIANDLKLRDEDDYVLTGAELDRMSDDDLEKVVEETSVYARVSPEHKVKIVSALKDRGHTTSMTGDGVNDAPALKQADIGVAMGITGTEVSKGSADMILTDDNFATIVSAVEEGRVIYSNIRKFVSFLLSCNVGEILVIFIANLILGPQYTPLVPIQLLWLNLVTDSFPALALGREKGEDDIMLQPPRPKHARILDRTMIWTIIVQAIAILSAVFAAFQVGRMLYPDVAASGGALAPAFSFLPLDGYLPSNGARTFAFITLILAELLRSYSARSEHMTVFHLGLFTNPTLNKAFLLSLVLTLAVVYVPFLDPLFHTISLNFRDWGVILGLAFIPFIVGELFKLIFRGRGFRSHSDEKTV